MVITGNTTFLLKNGNSEHCTHEKFFDIIRQYYTDYNSNNEILGENYMGYEIKREGYKEEHMDGIVVKKNHLIEIYQK